MSPEDVAAAIRGLKIPEVAAIAHRLCRSGQISGPTALALIVWPNQTDMTAYVKKAERAQEKLAA